MTRSFAFVLAMFFVVTLFMGLALGSMPFITERIHWLSTTSTMQGPDISFHAFVAVICLVILVLIVAAFDKYCFRYVKEDEH